MTTKAEEQRRYRRYAVKFPCVVKPKPKRKQALESKLKAETLDVSSHGFFIVTSDQWQIGAEIECELQLPMKAFGGKPVGIRCRGKVARLVPQAEGRIGVGATIDHYEFFQVNSPIAAGN